MNLEKNEYKNARVDYYQPWIALIINGVNNENYVISNEVISITIDLINKKKLTI